MAYSDKVIDHYKNPRNVGSFGTSTEVAKRPDIGVGIVGAPECGDVMQLQIKVDEARRRIEDAKFKCFGCGSAIASSSLATEWIKGKTLDEALTIRNTQIVEELSLPPVKIHCSVLAEDSIRSAIADYRKKNGSTPRRSDFASASREAAAAGSRICSTSPRFRRTPTRSGSTRSVAATRASAASRSPAEPSRSRRPTSSSCG
jgi:Fe-S cluster assembly scaffold IscU